MSSERGMFRIYKCHKCSNTGFSSVRNEEEDSKCSFCNNLILHEKNTLYAVTVQEAEDLVRDLAFTVQPSGPVKVRRGLGLRKRVYFIVESMVEMNRGRPATIKQILTECSEANIPPERATHFLNVLKSEGLLIDTSEGLMIEGGMT